MAVETALSLFIGTDFKFRFTIKDSVGSLVDVTGWAMSFMVKENALDADDDAVIDKTNSSGLGITGTFGVDQIVLVTIEDIDTDTLDPRTYKWELKRTDPGLETIVAYGDLELVRSVHHE